MCCSTLSTKGGMVSVTKNYLDYKDWDEFKVVFIPTHFDTNKYLLILYFGIRYIQILIYILFGNYQIAHLHTAERGSFWRKRFLLRTFHKFGIKVVLHHHAAEFEDFYNKCSDGQKQKVQKTLAEADVNIVLSGSLVSMIEDKQPKANVEVLYNAVKTPEKNPYSVTARNVLFMGRLGVRKGTFDLLEAIKNLDNQISSDVKFYLCGDMGENEVRAKVKDLGIEHRIAHIGWIDGTQKKEIFTHTMIHCLPSYNEGLPMSILETMSLGIPNISTNIASIPEVLHDGENGFLITPGDVDALANKLLVLINEEELRLRFSLAAYDTIKSEFSFNTNAAKLKQIYRDLLCCN